MYFPLPLWDLFYLWILTLNNVMYYRLNRNSFVRVHGSYAYITSQLTKHDCIYDQSGAVFLQSLERKAKSLDELVKEIAKAFIDVSPDDIKDDVREFYDQLTEQKYLTRGESADECDENEDLFYYGMEQSKTEVRNFLQNRDDMIRYRDTSDFFYEYNHNHPTIHGCQIEVNNKCNERCIHCYIPHQFKTKRLSFEQISKVLHELHDMGTLSLTLSGGECLMHPDFADILRLACNLDFSITVLSNLTLLTEEMVQVFKEVNLSLVQTSLYSMVPEEHDHITAVPGSFVKTKAAIEKLVAANVPVQISCPTMRTNFRTYKEVLKYAHSLRCKAQTDFIMMARSDFSTDNLSERLSLEETKQLIRDMIETDVDYDALMSEYTPRDLEKEKDLPVCGVAVDNICLGANGEYYPCSGWQGMPVGTIDTPLKDLWENSPQLQYLRSIKKGSFPKCMTCRNRDFCAACLVRNFNESGGDCMKVSKHFCEVARINRELVEEARAEWSKTHS